MLTGKHVTIVAVSFVLLVVGGGIILFGSSGSLGTAGDRLEQAQEGGESDLVTERLPGTVQGVMGLDISLGTYRSDSKSVTCQWERLEIGKDEQTGGGVGLHEVDLGTELVQFLSSQCSP